MRQVGTCPGLACAALANELGLTKSTISLLVPGAGLGLPGAVDEGLGLLRHAPHLGWPGAGSGYC